MSDDTKSAVDEAIDSAYVLGQIDAISMLIVPGYDPKGLMLKLMLIPGGFEAHREELVWKLMSWCLAHNLAFAAGR